MELKPNPYCTITPELAASGLLIPIKEAAANERACEGTLKANAKSRRLRAYQAHFGAPVMVLPDEVGEFLRSRPDIASNHHPKGNPAVSAAGYLPATEKRKSSDDLHFPVQIHPHATVGDFGIHITLRSLGNTTPSERALVAKAFTEVARQINETIPATAGNHPQH